MSDQARKTRSTRQADRPADRKVLMLFVALAFVFFAAPLVQKAYMMTVLDASFMFIGFLAVMVAEGLALAVVLRLERNRQWIPATSFLLAAGLMALNVFHFFFVVTNSAPVTLSIIVLICSILLVASFWSDRANDFFLRLCGVMLFVMCATELAMQHNAGKTEAKGIATARGTSAQRSVYVIVFDALASRKALTELYGFTVLPHVKYLEQTGFQLYDTYSPGHDTIDTFVGWFSLGTVHTSRNARHYFNGSTASPLYSLLREKQFKIQFMYHSNYFGVNAGRIDSFYPERNDISVCEFVDPRYVFGICGNWAVQTLWKPLLSLANRKDMLVLNEPAGGFEFVANRLTFAKTDDAARWFSVSYVWFPGHSSTYLGNDFMAKEKYRREMAEKLPQLNDKFGFLKQLILSNDPSAAIVFVGDHGGMLTGRWSIGASEAPVNGTKAILELDRAGILLAVYPNTFCSQQLAQMKNSTLIMKLLADCAG